MGESGSFENAATAANTAATVAPIGNGTGGLDAVGERRALRTLALIKSLHLVVFALVMPLGPQFARVLGLSPIEHGALSAAYPIAAGVTGFLALFVTNRFAGRRSLIVLCASFALALFAFASSSDFTTMLISRAVCGVIGGFICAWLPISITRATSPTTRNAGLKRSLGWKPAVAIGLGLPVMIYIATHADWRVAFALLGVAAAVLMVVAVFTLPQLKHPSFQPHTNERQLRVLMHHPRNRRALSASALLAASSALMVTFFSGIMVVNAGLTEAHLPYLFLIGGTFTLLAMPTIERLTRGGRRPFGVFVGVAIASVLTYVEIAILHHPPTPLILVVTVTTLFMLTNSARFAPVATLVNVHLKPRYVARYLGLGAVVQQFTAGVGFFVAGLCITHPVGHPLHRVWLVAALASGLLVSAVWLASRLNRHPKYRAGDEPLPLISERTDG